MQIVLCSATFTRPNDTTAYTSGDLIANSTTAGSVAPMTFVVPYGRGFRLWKANLGTSSTSVTNAQFRLHLYKDSPTAANGDNGSWSTTSANYQGYVDINGTGQAFTDSGTASGVYVNNSVFAPWLIITDVDRKLYGLLEARAAYTPTALGTFTVTLVGESYV